MRTRSTSIAASTLLAFLCVFYWYGFLRSLVVFPGPFQYLGLVAFAVGILSGPALILLTSAQIVLNRGVSVKRHLGVLLLAVTLGAVACEGMILAHDASITKSQAGIGAARNRWFPFSFRTVRYNEASGRYYGDF